jgi:excisionase family DNA binding protein
MNLENSESTKSNNIYTNINELPLVLTVSDVSRILGIGKANVYELCHSDNFPSVTIGKRIIVPKLAFVEWMKNPKSYNQRSVKQ